MPDASEEYYAQGQDVEPHAGSLRNRRDPALCGYLARGAVPDAGSLRGARSGAGYVPPRLSLLAPLHLRHPGPGLGVHALAPHPYF
jgi:hypothetical protein